MGVADFQDCQVVIRAFEKGCAYSTDERSVFATQTGFLQDVQSVTASVGNISDLVKQGKIENIDRELEEEEGENKFKDKVVDWLKDCIPCSLSINFEAELDLSLDALYDMLLAAVMQFLRQIEELLELFKGWDKKVDPCAFFNFLFDWVCLPDLYKILAMLSMLLFDLASLLDGIGLDLVLSLVVPLLLPFLLGVVAIAESFLLMILQPLQCIADSATGFLDKLDWGGLSVPVKFDVRLPGRVAQPVNAVTDWVAGKEYWTNDGTRVPTKEHKLGWEPVLTNSLLTDVTEGLSGDGASTSFRLGEDVASDPSYHFDVGGAIFGEGGLESFNQKNKAALESWRKNKNDMKKFMRSFIMDLVLMIRVAADKVRGLIAWLIDEVKKLLEEHVLGFSASLGKAGAQKLAILHLIGFVRAIIAYFKERPDCTPEDKQKAAGDLAATALSGLSGYTASQDEDGRIRLEQPSRDLDDVRRLLNSAVGVDGGNILQTGNEAIDVSLAGIVEKITTPVNVVYGCPYDVSVVDANEINDWILGK